MENSFITLEGLFNHSCYTAGALTSFGPHYHCDTPTPPTNFAHHHPPPLPTSTTTTTNPTKHHQHFHNHHTPSLPSTTHLLHRKNALIMNYSRWTLLLHSRRLLLLRSRCTHKVCSPSTLIYTATQEHHLQTLPTTTNTHHHNHHNQPQHNENHKHHYHKHHQHYHHHHTTTPPSLPSTTWYTVRVHS